MLSGNRKHHKDLVPFEDRIPCIICNPVRYAGPGPRLHGLCSRHRAEQERIDYLRQKSCRLLQHAYNLNPQNEQLGKILEQLKLSPDPSLKLPTPFDEKDASVMPQGTRKGLDHRVCRLVEEREELGKSPDSSEAWCRTAESMLERKQYDDAVVAYEQALRVDSRSLMSLRGLASALRALDRHTEAMTVIDRALAIDPAFALGWRLKGALLRDLSKHEEGLACYERGLEIDPNDPILLRNKGNALRQLDRTAEALICYDRALALSLESFSQKAAHQEAPRGLFNRLFDKQPQATEGDWLAIGIKDRECLHDWLKAHGFSMVEKPRVRGSTTLSDGSHHDHYDYGRCDRTIWGSSYHLGTWEPRGADHVVLSYEKPESPKDAEKQPGEWNRLASLLQTISEQKRS